MNSAMRTLPAIVSGITQLLGFAGCGYYLLALWSARSFVRANRRPLPDFHPPVSILKPVKGLDPEMYESFASHCRQDYPGDYELIFAAGSREDPAVAAIERVQREFPERAIQLVFCPETLGTNGKVSSLVQALPHAKFDHIVISDSDIVVSPRYLRRIMSGFVARIPEKRVGMVTALYRGKAYRTIPSRLEALGIGAGFASNVLIAHLLEGGIHFGLGSTLAVTGEALDAIGGLLPLADYVADDYHLGARIAAKGYEVVLSREVVETSVPPYRFGEFLAHQLRWARTVRNARPWGYFSMVVSYGLAWALLNVVASGLSLESLALLSIAVAAKVSVALLIGGELLGDRQMLGNLWLLPIRDLISLALWGWCYAGTTIHWRGRDFTVKNGRMVGPAAVVRES
jgi:ceramide glucosyltransferase